MKKDWSRVEKFRMKLNGMSSNPGDHFGVFEIPLNPRYKLFCIVTDGADYPGCPPEAVGWEHVSAHGEERNCSGGYKKKIPSWNIMQQLKEIFWENHETVVQYHPPKEDYVNVHPYTLHLWRHNKIEYPRPPLILL